jgi:hypothetical protein
MDGGAAAMALESYSDQVQRRGPPAALAAAL